MSTKKFTPDNRLALCENLKCQNWTTHESGVCEPCRAETRLSYPQILGGKLTRHGFMIEKIEGQWIVYEVTGDQKKWIHAAGSEQEAEMWIRSRTI